MGSSVRLLFSRRMLIMLLLGFSSGLPLLATGETLKAWATVENVKLTTIGLYSLIGLPYSFKFLWASLFDRYMPPFLGRRRGWMVLVQALLALSLMSVGFFHPVLSVGPLVACAVLVAFISASQDILLDGHRREMLSDKDLGSGTSIFVGGYRIGMLVGGAGAIYLSEFVSWQAVYIALGASVGIGILGTLLAPEPQAEHVPKSLREAVVEPFRNYMQRDGAVLFLVFILLYKLGDAMASSVQLTYIVRDLGYTRGQYAFVVKIVGTACAVGGSVLGAVLMAKLGLFRSLMAFGILQAFSVLSLVFLAGRNQDLSALGVIVGLENLNFGLGTAAYLSFIGSLCDRRFSVSQFALLSSLTGVPRTIIGSSGGKLAELLGWHHFFLLCTALAIPGLLLIRAVEKRFKNAESPG